MGKIKLRPFGQNDIPTLMDMVDSEEILKIWANPHLRFPLSPAQLKDCTHQNDSKRTYLAESNKQPLGYGEIREIDRKNLNAKIARIIIHPNFRGKDHSVEFMKLLLQIGFEQMNLHRLYLNVYQYNLPAINCYIKVGFQKEALLRDY